MSSRTEIAALGAITSLALAGDGVGLLLGASDTVALALLPVLAAGSAVAGVAGIRARRAHAAQREANRSDTLTGLHNAARLREDIAAFVAGRANDERRTLLIFDLVGFKRYNDSFGFACGDALLRRLAHKLVNAVGEAGQVYRLRGGQFAVVAAGRDIAPLRVAAGDALFEVGEGFMIRCAQGSAVLPRDTIEVSQALKLADQQVQTERATLRNQGTADLSVASSPAMAAERLAGSPYDIGGLSTAVGQCLGMSGDELDHLESAASLRDVGMIAVPDAIVGTPGRLTDEDWHFIQLHTLVGERLLRSNLGMDGVAGLVRSSHERWDGTGYPDRLAGEDIPLASRIVFVCSAFQDMTTQRPHRPALTAHQALRELERCAGTQFDPAVVAAFTAVCGEQLAARPYSPR